MKLVKSLTEVSREKTVLQRVYFRYSATLLVMTTIGLEIPTAEGSCEGSKTVSLTWIH